MAYSTDKYKFSDVITHTFDCGCVRQQSDPGDIGHWSLLCRKHTPHDGVSDYPDPGAHYPFGSCPIHNTAWIRNDSDTAAVCPECQPGEVSMHNRPKNRVATWALFRNTLAKAHEHGVTKLSMELMGPDEFGHRWWHTRCDLDNTGRMRLLNALDNRWGNNEPSFGGCYEYKDDIRSRGGSSGDIKLISSTSDEVVIGDYAHTPDPYWLRSEVQRVLPLAACCDYVRWFERENVYRVYLNGMERGHEVPYYVVDTRDTEAIERRFGTRNLDQVAESYGVERREATFPVYAQQCAGEFTTTRESLIASLVAGKPPHTECQCWVCSLASVGQWHQSEAESRIDYGGECCRAMGYGVRTWLAGARTERDGSRTWIPDLGGWVTMRSMV